MTTSSHNNDSIPVTSHEMELSSHEHPTAPDLEDAEAEAAAEVTLFLNQE